MSVLQDMMLCCDGRPQAQAQARRLYLGSWIRMPGVVGADLVRSYKNVINRIQLCHGLIRMALIDSESNHIRLPLFVASRRPSPYRAQCRLSYVTAKRFYCFTPLIRSVIDMDPSNQDIFLIYCPWISTMDGCFMLPRVSLSKLLLDPTTY